jgi:glucoamylase
MGDGEAFGAPGVPGRWTSGQKSGVGTALGPSPVWFTLSHGIVNEVYWPRMDQAAIRDLGLIVTAPDGLFAEEKRHAEHTVEVLAPGVPASRLTATGPDGRFRIVKEVITDPLRPVLLQRVRLSAPTAGAAGEVAA